MIDPRIRHWPRAGDRIDLPRTGAVEVIEVATTSAGPVVIGTAVGHRTWWTLPEWRAWWADPTEEAR